MKNKRNIVILILCGLILIIMSVGFSLYFKFDKEKSKVIVDNLFDNIGGTLVDTSISVRQEEIDKQIIRYQNDKKFTLKDPKIMINPYKISPLTAMIIFTTKEETTVQMEVNDKKLKFPKRKTHTIPIYGLYSNKLHDVKITLDNNETNNIKIQTEEVSNLYKPMNVITPNKNDDGYYFVTSPMGDSTVAYDGNGDIRWYLTANYHNDITLLENGHILLSNDTINDSLASASGFVEMDYLGKVYNEYLIPGGYHHDILELDNGNFIVASSNMKTTRNFDYLVEINRKTGKIVNNWDLHEIIKNIDKNFAKEMSDTWAWNNSVFLDKKNNQLILSLRNRNSVIAIGYKDKKLKWIFGTEKDWSSNFSKYLLKANETVNYPLGQHSAFITKEGYLGLFNNGYNANDGNKSIKCQDLENNYSSATLYKIEGKTISQIWDYNHNKELFSYALSNFSLLKDNHKLINFGWEFKDESFLDPECTQYGNLDIYSQIIELDNEDKVLFEATIMQGKYRVKKLDLYDKISSTYQTAPYKYFKEKSEKLEVVMAKDVQKQIENAPSFKFGLTITNTYFSSSALIPDNTEVKLAFVSESGEIYIYLLKEKDKEVLRTVYLDSMKGSYSLFLIWNQEYKNLNRIVTF